MSLSIRIQNRLNTKKRRKTQLPKIAELKLQKLTRQRRQRLKRLFLEAKWFYNWVVASLELRLTSKETSKVKTVEIKVKDHIEPRELKLLSSQMKQEIVQSIWNSLKSLKKIKGNGRKVGRLKFKSSFRSIPLKQPGVTFKFLNSQRTKVRIQNLGIFRVLGASTIPEGAEIAKAYLVRKATGYFLLVAYYVEPQGELKARKHKERFDYAVSFDPGIANQISFCNGIKLSWSVQEDERLKRLQRIFSKLPKGSKKQKRIAERIACQHQRLRNIRKDIINKIISLLKRYKAVGFQDDSIKSWHEGWFGAQVQHSALGGITARLKGMNKSLATPEVKVLPRFKATTQICSRCGHRETLSLSERTFRCSACGLVLDRDVNASRVIQKELGLDRPEGNIPMPEEVRVIRRLFVPLAKWVRVSYPPSLGILHPSGCREEVKSFITKWGCLLEI